MARDHRLKLSRQIDPTPVPNPQILHVHHSRLRSPGLLLPGPRVGRRRGADRRDLLLYDSLDLTTHAVCRNDWQRHAPDYGELPRPASRALRPGSSPCKIRFDAPGNAWSATLGERDPQTEPRKTAIAVETLALLWMSDG